jgi:hypothetical protein
MDEIYSLKFFWYLMDEIYSLKKKLLFNGWNALTNVHIYPLFLKVKKMPSLSGGLM